MTELHTRIIQRITTGIAHANDVLGENYPQPDIRFDLRGKAAGQALLQRWQLRFNPVLLRENPDAFIDEVVPHEICHLLAYARHGRVRPHGKEWQSLMRGLYGLEPKTTHTFDVESVEGATFPYRCHCDQINLSVRRHNKVQRKQAQYFCRKCKQLLVLQNQA